MRSAFDSHAGAYIARNVTCRRLAFHSLFIAFFSSLPLSFRPPFPFPPFFLFSSSSLLLSPSYGFGAAFQPKSNWVHRSFEIRDLLATVSVIFLRINWPKLARLMQYKRVLISCLGNWGEGLSPLPSPPGYATVRIGDAQLLALNRTVIDQVRLWVRVTAAEDAAMGGQRHYEIDDVIDRQQQQKQQSAAAYSATTFSATIITVAGPSPASASVVTVQPGGGGGSTAAETASSATDRTYVTAVTSDKHVASTLRENTADLYHRYAYSHMLTDFGTWALLARLTVHSVCSIKHKQQCIQISGVEFYKMCKICQAYQKLRNSFIT